LSWASRSGAAVDGDPQPRRQPDDAAATWLGSRPGHTEGPCSEKGEVTSESVAKDGPGCGACRCGGAGCGGVAGASEIVYDCAANLCAVNPDGTGETQLTNDGQAGTAEECGSPSISRNGGTLAFVYASRAYVGSTSTSTSAPSHAGTGIASTAVVALLRPDGQQVAELETALGQVQLCTYNADGSGRDCPYGTGSAGWSADNDHALISVSSDTPRTRRASATSRPPATARARRRRRRLPTRPTTCGIRPFPRMDRRWP
jgi:hypothetical protein